MTRTAAGILPLVILCFVLVVATGAQGSADASSPSSENGIPFKTPSDSQGTSSSRVLWVTLGAIILALVAVYLVRQYVRQKGWMPPQDASERMALSGVKRLSPKLTVYLITVDENEYLVAQSGDQTSIVQHEGKGKNIEVEQ